MSPVAACVLEALEQRRLLSQASAFVPELDESDAAVLAAQLGDVGPQLLAEGQSRIELVADGLVPKCSYTVSLELHVAGDWQMGEVDAEHAPWSLSIDGDQVLLAGFSNTSIGPRAQWVSDGDGLYRPVVKEDGAWADGSTYKNGLTGAVYSIKKTFVAQGKTAHIDLTSQDPASTSATWGVTTISVSAGAVALPASSTLQPDASAGVGGTTAKSDSLDTLSRTRAYRLARPIVEAAPKARGSGATFDLGFALDDGPASEAGFQVSLQQSRTTVGPATELAEEAFGVVEYTFASGPAVASPFSADPIVWDGLSGVPDDRRYVLSAVAFDAGGDRGMVSASVLPLYMPSYKPASASIAPTQPEQLLGSGMMLLGEGLDPSELLTFGVPTIEITPNYGVNIIDPHLATDLGTLRVVENAYSTLLRRGEAGDGTTEGFYGLYEELVSSWNVLEGNLIHTFTLREDAYYPDLTRVTAYDVVFSLNRIQAISPRSWMLDDMVSCVAVDDSTVRIELSAPSPAFFYCLANPLNAIIQRSAFDQNYDPATSVLATNRGGCGEYLITSVSGAVNEESVDMVRNDDYFALNANLPDALHAAVVPLVTGTAVTQLLSDDIGILPDLEIYGVNPGHIADIDTALGLVLTTDVNGDEVGDGNRMTFLRIMPDSDLLGDEIMRQAIAYAVDRETMLDGITGGLPIVSDTIMPLWHPYSSPVSGFTYDPPTAESLLYQSDYINSPFELQIAHASDVRSAGTPPEQPGAAQAIQAYLAAVGIASAVTAAPPDQDFRTWLTSNAALYDLALVSWHGDADPDSWASGLLRDQVLDGAGDAETDMANYVDDGRHTEEVLDRLAIYADLQELTADASPLMPISSEQHLTGLSPEVVAHLDEYEEYFELPMSLLGLRSTGTPLDWQGAAPTGHVVVGLAVNDGDADQYDYRNTVNGGAGHGDGVPDWADGYDRFSDEGDEADDANTAAGFTALEFTIPTGATAVTFVYSASDPMGVGRQGSGALDDPYTYDLPDGSFRLWTQSGSKQRTMTALSGYDNANSYFIDSDVEVPVAWLEVAESTVTVWIEAVQATHVENVAAYFEAHDPQLLFVAGIAMDIDVDSDLTGVISDTQFREDQHETDPRLPGQVILVNDNSRDGDATVDLAQDDDYGGLVPLKITIPMEIDISQVSLSIEYNASDPAKAKVHTGGATTPAYLTAYELDEGNFRIWATTSIRYSKSVKEEFEIGGILTHGSYVEPGTYGWSHMKNLGFSQNERSATLYIEAVRPTEGQAIGDRQVRVTLHTPSYGSASDVVTINALTAAPASSFIGITRFDGTSLMAYTDLSSSLWDGSWGLTRVISDAPEYRLMNLAGTNFFFAELPRLIQTTGSLVTVLDGTPLYFDKTVSGYTARYGELYQIRSSGEGADSAYTIYGPGGERWVFHDFAQTTPSPQRGMLDKYLSPGAQLTEVAYTTEGRLDTVTRQNETFEFTYCDTVFQTPLIDTVTLWRGVERVAEVEYSYYTASDGVTADGDMFHGNAGELESVSIDDEVGTLVDFQYYRYERKGDPNAPSRGDLNAPSRLAQVLGLDGLGQLGINTDLSTISNPGLQAHATDVIARDNNKVEKHTFPGGTTTSSSLFGTSSVTYTYDANAEVIGANAWRYKVHTALPGGLSATYYTTSTGQVMGTETSAVGPGLTSVTRYDQRNRPMLTATPAAEPDLSDGIYWLNDDEWADEGLSLYTTYHTNGYVSETGYQLTTETNDRKPQARFDYQAVTPVNEPTINVLKSVTGPNTSTGASNTTFSFGDFALYQPLEVTRTDWLHDEVYVSATQEFDVFGRPTVATDSAGIQSELVFNAAGLLTTAKYDEAGLNLTTTYGNHNAQGLPRQVTAPSGQVVNFDFVSKQTYSETWTKPALGPYSVVRRTLTGGEGAECGVVEYITLDRQPQGENYTVLSYTKEKLDNAGRVVEVASYSSVGTSTYSSTAGMSLSGTLEYDVATAEYGQWGAVSTTDAAGDTTWYEYNGAGQVTDVWIGTSMSDRVKISHSSYDTLSRLSDSTLYAGQDPERKTSYRYDDSQPYRLIATQSGDAASYAPITWTTYDGDRVSAIETFHGESIQEPALAAKPAQALRTSFTEYTYEGTGDVRTVRQHSIDSSGNSTASLVSESYLDSSGRPWKSVAADGTTTITAYDLSGRIEAVSIGDGTVTLEQTNYVYDSGGNVIVRSVSRRVQAGQMQTSHQAFWYDQTNRLVASADYGVTGQSTLSRPVTPPARSDSILVSSVEYDNAGRAYKSIDPRGIEARTEYDALGRAVKTIANYVDGAVGTDEYASDITTLYTYTSLGQLRTITSDLPGSVDQTTEYVYGVNQTGELQPNITSNALLRLVKFPDKTSGEPSASAANQLSYTYNTLGQTHTVTDRNQTVHTYSYDALGRPTRDGVTSFGTGVDNAVRALTTEYNERGQAWRFQSWDQNSHVVSEVTRDFNGFGQLLTETQDVDGVGMIGGETVRYSYDSVGRTEGMMYPNGRAISYEYSQGRLSAIKDEDASTLQTYAYLGLGIIARSNPGIGLDLNITLDTLGRVQTYAWTSDSTPIESYTYGYDRNSNVLYKRNDQAAAFSELYHANGAAGYDGLNRMTAWSRGNLNLANDTIAIAAATQNWSLDAMGNFQSVTRDNDGDGGNDPVVEGRGNNAQNQVTSVAGQAALAYDSNGNLTAGPIPHDPATAQHYVYDAWNRLVAVKTDDQGQADELIATYRYDALGRRVQKTLADGFGDTVFNSYYSGWNIVEVHQDGQLFEQFVWDATYIDTPILRDRDADGVSTTGDLGLAGSGLEQRVYYLTDAGRNITALVDAAGDVVERYVYDPYGKVTVLTASFAVRGDGSAGASLFGNTNLFAGYRLDAESGLYEVRHRYYDSNLGRFTSNDPTGYADGLNMYAYAGGHPAGATDAMGLEGHTTTRPAVVEPVSVVVDMPRVPKTPKVHLGNLYSATETMASLQAAVQKNVEGLTVCYLTGRSTLAHGKAIDVLDRRIASVAKSERLKTAAGIAEAALEVVSESILTIPAAGALRAAREASANGDHELAFLYTLMAWAELEGARKIAGIKGANTADRGLAGSSMRGGDVLADVAKSPRNGKRVVTPASHTNGCAPAAMSMFLAAQGIRAHPVFLEAAMLREMGKPYLVWGEGFEMKTIVAGLKSRGAEVRFFESASTNVIETMTKSGQPAIVGVRSRRAAMENGIPTYDYHAIIVDGVTHRWLPGPDGTLVQSRVVAIRDPADLAGSKGYFVDAAEFEAILCGGVIWFPRRQH